MKQELWNTFCTRFHVYEHCVPLFSVDDDLNVHTRSVGRGGTARLNLARSQECEALILRVTDRLVEDWTSGTRQLDGMLYMMGWKRSGGFVPLYIGKAESTGRGGGLSANITNLHTEKSKFARWGDNYAYHIGDLSACVLPGHRDKKKVLKYESWADRLFVSGTSRLRQPVYFWATAWNRADVGIWEEFGPTSLAFLEYLLIGVASGISPELLNKEGRSR